MGIELAKAFITVRSDMSRVEPDIKGVQPGVENALRGVIGSANRLMGMLGASLAVGYLAKIGIQTAAAAEQSQIAFETMLGSGKEAQDLLKRLTEFAAKTPFNMPGITAAARGLVMFGERGDQLMDTLKALGNAAAGTSSDFGMIALIYNQIRGVGKLLTQDFRQLSTRGVLSLQDIAKYFGVTAEAAQEMLSKGKISFEDVRGILKGLSEEGGRFANMMEKQSRSLAGLWSTLKDNLGILLRKIAEQFMPIMKNIVWVVNAIIDRFGWLIPTVTKFGVVILTVVSVVWTINKAMWAFKMAQQAAAKASIMLQAANNPAGLAKVTAGLIAAAGVIAYMESKLAEAEETTGDWKKQVEDLKGELGAVGEAGVVPEAAPGAVPGAGAAAAKARPLLEVGFVGLAEMGKQIQQAMVKPKEEVQKMMLGELKDQTKVLQEIQRGQLGQRELALVGPE